MRADTRLTSTLEAFGREQGEVSFASLGDFRRGLEKESLRVTGDCRLVLGKHPEEYGSSLTHPQITTDFSEAQLEFITGVHASVPAMLEELSEIHRFVYQGPPGNLLWAASMPCLIGGPEDIEVGKYGTSHIAKLKTTYRRGLELRYGKPMQMISGIHFNFSLADDFWRSLMAIEGADNALQDFKTRRYFDMIRNFRRAAWLLLYLFGASPAVSRCFPTGVMPELQKWGDGTLYLPHATSLRMGRIGYQSSAQEKLHVSFNDLASYTSSLAGPLSEPYPPYADEGIQDESGEYKQLSTSLLQIENEFYSAVRPKCIAESGERPLNALAARGVEYVEVRLLDVNPFLPLGIDDSTIRFVELFLLRCLLVESPPDTKAEAARQDANDLLVVEEGRRDGLGLATETGEESMLVLAEEIIADCMPLAQALDKISGDSHYMNTLTRRKVHLRHSDETPSGQMLSGMRAYDASFCKLAMTQSLRHQAWFQSRPLGETKLAEMRTVAAESLAEQTAIEGADSGDFEAFRKDYIEQNFTLS